MPIFFNSNHLKAIIYTNQCCVPSFMPNKSSFNYLKQASAIKALKTIKIKSGT